MAGPMTAAASWPPPAARCAWPPIYVPNGRVVDSEFYLEKLEWLARLSVWLNDNDPSTELAICGDYNVAPEDIDVWDVNAVHGATHVSPRERAAVAKLRAWGMVDIVRQFHPEPGFFTWWDYRAGHFHKNFGMRIDHVYVSPPLAARAIAAERDREARKPSTYPGIPSDHAPAHRRLRRLSARAEPLRRESYDPVVTLLDIGLLFVALMLISFTLGAAVMWSLEGRDRRMPPLWLVIVRHASQIALVAYLVIASDPPTGVVTDRSVRGGTSWKASWSVATLRDRPGGDPPARYAAATPT